MRYELHKWLSHEFARIRVRRQQIVHAVNGEHSAKLHYFDDLLWGLFAPKTG